MKDIKKFRIIKVIYGQNLNKTGECAINYPVGYSLGDVREYESKYGIFYISIQELNSCIKKELIKVIE